jgi:hypothetical protein
VQPEAGISPKAGGHALAFGGVGQSGEGLDTLQRLACPGAPNEKHRATVLQLSLGSLPYSHASSVFEQLVPSVGTELGH